MGLLQMAAGNGAKAAGSKARLSRDNVLNFVRTLIPQRLRMAISQAFFSHAMKDKLALKWLTAGIAWENTRAFLISNANEGYVRINLKGREPQGTVTPGAEYQALIDELYEVFRSMKNPENGMLAAASVYKADQIFSGPCRDQMPDLIVNWNLEARITDQLLTAKFGNVKTRQPGYGIVPFYVGNHRPNAFAYIVGPGIPEGERIDGGHILDLTPTILARLGVPAPSHMDGKLLDLSPRAESKAVAS
jgi:predicted AlkP superfamily phosphohydrolase/phosphomutase